MLEKLPGGSVAVIWVLLDKLVYGILKCTVRTHRNTYHLGCVVCISNNRQHTHIHTHTCAHTLSEQIIVVSTVPHPTDKEEGSSIQQNHYIYYQ